MDISDFNYIDYIYFLILILFCIFFGIKGATKSISYSLKIIFSVAVPFIFYKRILNFTFENMNNDYLFSLQNDNSIFLEIISFTIIFLLTYIAFSIIEKVLNLESPNKLKFRILDITLGVMYGILIFSITFYFAYNIFLKNHIKVKNSLMKLNISLYESHLYKDNQTDNIQNNKPSKKNDQKKLY